MRLSDLPALPAAGLVTGQIPVRYAGGNYRVPLSDVSGGVTSAVSPQQYGGDPTGSAASDAAVAAAFATGRPVMIDGWYRLTSTFNMPNNSQMQLADFDCGFIADMATGYALSIGSGSIVRSLRVRSNAYPASAIADNTDWSDYQRAVRVNSDVQMGYVWLSDLAGGIDIFQSSNITIDYLYARNIRSRLGQAAAWHPKQSTDCWVGYIDAKDCDRGCEPEWSVFNSGVLAYRMENIYPAGYTGQPAGYATYSFVLSVHSHPTEGRCAGIFFGDGLVKNCLSPITIEASYIVGTPAPESAYPADVRLGHVTIESPRAGRIPVSLNGIGVRAASIRFTGTAGAGLTQLIQLGIANVDNLARAQVLESLTVEDGAFTGRVLRADAQGCALRDFDIGAQAGTSALTMFHIADRGHRFHFNRGIVRGAKSHAAIYDSSGTPANVRREHTAFTLDGSTPATASRSAAWQALAGKYEVNNADF